MSPNSSYAGSSSCVAARSTGITTAARETSFRSAGTNSSNRLPEAQRGEDLVAVYHQLLHSEDPDVAARAAIAWSAWEGSTSYLYPQADKIEQNSETRFALAFARIENHYFVNGGFFDENQLLRKSSALQGIPGTIVQGRYDVVCPATSAWALHKAWPESKLVIVDDAGHSAMEPGIMHHLVEATDSYR